jgi:hypothetical protein
MSSVVAARVQLQFAEWFSVACDEPDLPAVHEDQDGVPTWRRCGADASGGLLGELNAPGYRRPSALGGGHGSVTAAPAYGLIS